MNLTEEQRAALAAVVALGDEIQRYSECCTHGRMSVSNNLALRWVHKIRELQRALGA